MELKMLWKEYKEFVKDFFCYNYIPYFYSFMYKVDSCFYSKVFFFIFVYRKLVIVFVFEMKISFLKYYFCYFFIRYLFMDKKGFI